MEYEIPASQKDRKLPMIINLRGDEDLVDEFSWDADQVMEFLGIKRSRLTQISGKELRVARIRRDRYVRPVYREADVRDYQEWTRATATHQSSSRAIEQAIDSLDDRFSDILVVLQEKLLQYEDRSSLLLRQLLQRLQQAGFEQHRALLDAAESQKSQAERQEKKQDTAQRQQLAQQASLSAIQEDLQDLRGLFGSFHQELRSLIVAQQSLRRDLQEMHDSWQSSMDRYASQLSSQSQLMHEALSLLQAGQKQILAQTEKELPAPVRPIPLRRIKRRPYRLSRLELREGMNPGTIE